MKLDVLSKIIVLGMHSWVLLSYFGFIAKLSTPFPWRNIERILFGFENSPNEINLPVESYQQTITCKENLHSDVIFTFLQHLAFKLFGKI